MSVAKWIAGQKSTPAARDPFPRRENMNLLYNDFEDSNEEKMSGQQKEEFVKIQWNSSCAMVLWKLLNTCG